MLDSSFTFTENIDLKATGGVAMKYGPGLCFQKYYNKENTHLQLCEDIEWMKLLEQGFTMNCVKIEQHEIGVDTKEDYLYLKNKYETNS